MKMQVNNSLFHCFLAIGALENFPIRLYISPFAPFLVCSKKTKFFCSVELFKRDSEGSENIIKTMKHQRTSNNYML